MSGDSGVFRENCSIHRISFPFNSDFHRLRPFVERQGINLGQLGYSSGDLHKLTSTQLLEGRTHDALHDCRSMAVWLKYAQSQSWFTSLSELPTEIPQIDPRARGRDMSP